MVLEIPGGLFGQQDVRETPSDVNTSSSTSSSTIIAPIGTILPWLKSYTNTPQTLPTGWIECDGSAISDAESVYDGQNAPDLNGGEFIRGAGTSGGTGGGTTGTGSAHTHAETLGTSSEDSHYHPLADDTGNTLQGGESWQIDSSGGTAHSHNITGSITNESSHTHTSAPKYYDVVWIIRIK